MPQELDRSNRVDESNVDDRKLFVGGLKSTTRISDLRDHFGKFGEIERCTIPHELNPKRKRGFGFIVFKDASTLDVVINAGNHIIDGWKVDIKKHKIEMWKKQDANLSRIQTYLSLTGNEHPVQEDRSRSPRRYSMNRSRSHSRSRSPVHHRQSPWSEIDKYPSRQFPLPTPQAPTFATSNRPLSNQQGLTTYPAMFGSASPGTSKNYSTQPVLISNDHLSQSANQSKMSNTAPVTSTNFSVLGLCNMLRSMCNQLDILGQSDMLVQTLKHVLEKAFQLKHDENKMLDVIAVDDHIKLMRMVLTRFSILSEEAPDTDIQTKITIKNLVNQTTCMIKMAEDLSFSAFCTKMNVSKSSSSNRSLLYGIDVEEAARLTLNRDTSYIIAHIKNDLENIGTTPSKEIVSKLALEISVRHFKMAAKQESFTVDYGHAPSSSSLNKIPISTDYGHGANKASGSFNIESQRLSNMGNVWDQNRGNAMIPHNEWSHGTLGQVSETQEWHQRQGHGMAQMWPEGQSSVMLHGPIQGQEVRQSGGNLGGQWFQGHTNERL